MTYVSKKSRLLAAFRNKKSMTAKQIQSRFKFAHERSVHGTLCSLRNDGYNIIVAGKTASGLNRYSLA